MSKMPTRVSASGTTETGAQFKALILSVIDALNSGGYQSGNRTTVTTTSTLTITQSGLVLADCTSGNVVLTLPASGATADDAVYLIRRIDSTANTLTVIPSGADTIEGVATAQPVANGGVLQLQIPAGSTNWRVLSTNAQKAGTLFLHAGSAAPIGTLALPLVATTISRTTYAALFAAIGTIWGVGDGSTTFGMPYLAADHTFVQANANVGTLTAGQVISHTHGLNTVAGYAGGATSAVDAGGASQATAATGGAANLAAGRRALWCVQC